MLNKEQANSIANATLAQARSDSLESRNSRARRIAWVHRVPGLEVYEPYEEAVLLKTAKAQIVKVKFYWFAMLAWMCVLVGASWYVYVHHRYLFLLLAPVALIGPECLRIPFIRSELSRLVNTRTEKRSET
jgi:hypothetical protein